MPYAPPTHCPLGHEYSADNTLRYMDQTDRLRQICLTCEAQRSAVANKRSPYKFRTRTEHVKDDRRRRSW